jgi:GT2 family glycosyltransferase
MCSGISVALRVDMNNLRSEQQQPKVAAVVVTWNDIELASGCVRSLLASDYRNLHVMVVDNGSVEPCGERLKQRFPQIEVLVLPKNLGYTGGSNAGLQRALEMGMDYVQLYNNDIVVEPNTVSLLVEAFQRYPEAGIMSPVLLAPAHDGVPELVMFYSGTLDRDTARHDHLPVEVEYASREWPDAESPFVPFCATMFRSSALRRVGYLDETLGTCWEDFDMCVRLAEAGYRIMTVGAARAVHFHGQTTGRVSPYITYYVTRNRLICLFRYNSVPSVLWRAPYIARSFGWQIRKFGILNWDCHRAFALAVRDFALGRRGESAEAIQMRRKDKAAKETAKVIAPT